MTNNCYNKAVKIAILGYGVEGKLAYDYWNRSGNQITIHDHNKTIVVPDHIHTILGDKYLKNLSDYDLIIRSPSLHPNEIVKANIPDILNKVTTTTNEFFKVTPTKNIIGVTGTKGKGTTTTLIARLLEAAGHKVHIGGNIGNGALDILRNNVDPNDWIVLELSSFQLIDLKYSPHIAVCLMISPEHLNWHQDMDEYITAKKNIFSNQLNSDIAIYYSKNEYSTELAQASIGYKIPYYEKPGAYVDSDRFIIAEQEICKTNELQLIGEHNWQNVCAALTAFWRISQDPVIAKQVITKFKGLEHRLELVKDVNGIKYYNDSFASAPPATIAAIESIRGSKIIIIGGFDRNLGLNELALAIKTKEFEIRSALLVGASRHRLAEALENVDFKNYKILDDNKMSDIVKSANEIAKNGDSIVLTPGFASFDMFKNFEDRGLQFKEVVNKL